MALAGNDGPTIGTVTNTAPWIVTIATSGIERAFKSTLQLGNGKNVTVSFILLPFEYSERPK